MKPSVKTLVISAVLGLILVFPLTRLVWGQTFQGPSTSAGTGVGAIGVNSSNNVSVGTSTPFANTKLLVVASSTDTSNYALQVVKPDQTPVLVVRNDGSVGIGTSSPAYTLDVAGNVRLTGTLTSASFSGTISAGNVSSGYFGSNTGGGNYSFPASLSVSTSTAPTGGVAYFNGNVGIGTASPAGKLDVSGGQLVIDDGSFGSLSLKFRGASTGFFRSASGGNIEVDVGGLTALQIYANQLMVNRGTAAAPGVAWSDGTNTGMYGPATNKIGFAIAGNAAMLINASSNVGIGTVNPNQKLEVVGNVSSSALCLGGTCNSTWASGLSGGQANYIPLWSSATAQGTSTLYQSGSYVGIGTAIPGKILDVYGSSGANITGRVRNGGVGTAELMLDGGAGIGGDSLVTLDHGGIVKWSLHNVAGSSDLFQIDSGSVNNAFTILQNGSVGISTTTPTNPLSVQGNANISGTLTVGTLSGAGAGFSNMQVFSTSGTFTIPTGVAKILVEVWGGGGGGGATWTAHACSGSGGGGGGYSKGIFSVTGGTQYTVTIGSGGTTPASTTVDGTVGGGGGTSSFGALISATGGAGGNTTSTLVPANTCSFNSYTAQPGGIGGTGSGGQMNVTGGMGAIGFYYGSGTYGMYIGGTGGGTGVGGGGSNGLAGQWPGGGGGGGSFIDNGRKDIAGSGVGASGGVVVWY